MSIDTYNQTPYVQGSPDVVAIVHKQNDTKSYSRALRKSAVVIAAAGFAMYAAGSAIGEDAYLMQVSSLIPLSVSGLLAITARTQSKKAARLASDLEHLLQN